MTDFLAAAYPLLADRLRKMPIADLPTPVSTVHFDTASGSRSVSIKHDDVSSAHYGGNKIRKLEYILQRARDRGATRIATFGAVGSNHALATAILAAQTDFDCTCFLGAQPRAPNIARALNMHRRLGTELVPLGRTVDRIATFRRFLQGRHCWVIPMGGSSWLGAVGFVNAGLELAHQVESGALTAPHRIYIANGTMGSSTGLALGLALAELPVELHAVRVVDDHVASPSGFERLMRKTAMMMRRLDPSIPIDLADRTRMRWRDEFLAGGYASFDNATRNAVEVAADAMGLALETTYTGKAMAALLRDLESPDYAGEKYLFWNTYNSRPLPVTRDRPDVPDNIPPQFMTYFD
ncbi:MAG: pyridoxal-phosphate dependent enzyme [Gammaproteobacteria bacterium]|nr:pyridoxal-phosphate dependent enzyme [Gammaproteobacteria bacterium]NNC58250.1 pyridoxal-phosphate dependent enzyme [Woeseiaceae bacterium]